MKIRYLFMLSLFVLPLTGSAEEWSAAAFGFGPLTTPPYEEVLAKWNDTRQQSYMLAPSRQQKPLLTSISKKASKPVEKSCEGCEEKRSSSQGSAH